MNRGAFLEKAASRGWGPDRVVSFDELAELLGKSPRGLLYENIFNSNMPFASGVIGSGSGGSLHTDSECRAACKTLKFNIGKIAAWYDNPGTITRRDLGADLLGKEARR